MNDRPQLAAPGAILPDQPPTTPGEGDVWRELIDAAGPAHPDLVPLMEERRRLGISRYGTPLQRANGRDHRADAAQELLDAAVYLWAAGEPVTAFAMLVHLDEIRGRM